MDIRRETQSFYAGFFIWPLSRAAPMARKFVSPQRAPKVEPPRSASSFNSLNFLRNPPNPARASGAWRHPHFVTRFIISGYCDISEWHVRFVRPRTLPPASRLHLTNLCAELKGSQVLSKPKSMNRNPSAIILHICQIIERIVNVLRVHEKEEIDFSFSFQNDVKDKDINTLRITRLKLFSEK